MKAFRIGNYIFVFEEVFGEIERILVFSEDEAIKIKDIDIDEVKEFLSYIVKGE